MNTEPKPHRDIAGDYLISAEKCIGDDDEGDTKDTTRNIALAQTHALIAIGHALVDLAKDGVFTYARR